MRHLDWVEALDAESQSDVRSGPDAQLAYQDPDQEVCSAVRLAPGDKYDVILGSDILYEVPPLLSHECRCLSCRTCEHHACCSNCALWLQAAHAPLVAAVVRDRLEAHGQAFLCCAVREKVRLV